MFIKRMEIFGFKSFKNKTVLEFDSDYITGFVGPNGCGKSNVVDALLWVMGESSPKHLRGESLSDVVFAGTTKESPGNLAEVNLTLGKGHVDFPENYKKFSELMITRRSYRDGKNEYFINQKACLLRDVRELFMNTGAGCRGFSIIEQESIEKLITAKPIQRRFIIEEVAGISKFKDRKNETARKLDLVNQNLQRLNDVLKIQESQLSQLTSQAKKAEKYRKLKQEIESRQRRIEKKEQEDLFCAYKDLEKEQESLKIKTQEKRKKHQAVEEQIEKEKTYIKMTEEQIKKEQANVETTKQTAMNKKMEEAGLLNQVKAFEMIDNINNRKKTLIDNINNSKQALEEKEKTLQKELAQIQDFFKDKADIKEFERESGQIKNHLNEVKQNRKEAEINIGSFQKQIGFIEKEIKVLFEEKQNIQTQIQKNINDKKELSSLFEKHEQENLNSSEEMNVISEKEKNIEDKKENIEKETNYLNQTVFVLQHKIEEMRKLISRFEVINEGASDLTKWKPEEFRPLFRNLKVDSDYATALGAVLGHHIQALIPKEDVVGIEQAVQRLKNQRKGKTSFLSSLPHLTIPLSLRQKMKTYPAFICFLDEKIRWNIYTETLRSFLEQTVVVSDLSSAFELKRQFPAFQFVTKEGDLITRDSLVYAGSSDKETSLFRIRDQIEEYSKELSTKEIELKIKKVNLESCVKQLKQIRQNKQHLQNKMTQNYEKLVSIKKDVEQMEKDLLRLSENRKKNDQRTEDFGKERQNLLQHEEACNKEIQILEDVLSLKESRLQILQTTIDEYEAQNLQKTKWERELLDNKKDQENLNQEVSLLLNLMGRTENSEREDNKVLNQGKKSMSDLNLEKEMNLIREQKQKLDAQLLSFQKELEKQNQLKEKQDENIKDLEKQIFQIKLDISGLESEWDKKELEKTYLKNKFLENYKLQIEDFVSSPQEIPLEKLKEEMNHYEKQLDRIKEVNFLALEEYEKLSKENFFLNEQREDLVNSKKEIIKVISHIDKLCETRFTDMLEEINKRFSKVFPIIFQGDNAKAQLILHEEPGDKEPGVDILIHPPGKRPQSVSLLSRGEKALTSVCLIYSLFLVKPSPFCIIDEADAPLDDANIFRFISVLKEMSQKSQMIVVTHNKYTMQACRKLYGVTMEQPGISQIVSVDQHQPLLFQ